METEKCFAWRDDIRYCGATIITCDGHDDRCPFYKTAAEQKASEARAMAHLADLSPLRQKTISETYYHGIRLWELKVAREQG